MPTTQNNAGVGNLLGVFKDAWKDGVVNTYAGDVPLLASTRFEPAAEVGGTYHVPTRLSLAGGFTFAPSSSSSGEVLPGAGGRTFVGPNASVILDAQVLGYQFFGRGRVTYEALARSAANLDTTSKDGKKAAENALRSELDGMSLGGLKKLEALMLHGQRGLGQVEFLSDVVATSYQGTSGFAIDLGITAGTWIEALFLASERHGFSLFANSAGVPTGAALNTATNSIWDGQSQTGLALIAVMPSATLANYTGTANDGTRVIRLWSSSGTGGGAGVGIIGGIAYNSISGQSVHVGFESAGSAASGFNEFAGFGVMASNTGTLFNINAATYSMWRGNLNSTGGVVKLPEIIRAAARSINAGAKGKRMRAVVPTELFAQLGNDEAALRRYSGREATGVGGMQNIECYLPLGGVLEVMGHPLQKAGEVLIYPPEGTMRVGSMDVDFVAGEGRTGVTRNAEKLMLEVADLPAREVRTYANFAAYAECPKHMTLMTGVTY